MQAYQLATDRSPRWRLGLLALLSLLLLLALGSRSALAQGGGTVYVMNNDAAANAVLVFEQAADGTLTPVDEVLTGGQGTGGGLGSQGALAVSRNQKWLFVVNAGSNEVSSFVADGNTLTHVSTVPSGGEMPISLTTRGRLLYVLNAGGSGNLTGFHITGNGELKPIPNDGALLSNDGVGAAPGPAQVSFSPNGRLLVVTEKATDQILTYRVRGRGRLSAPTINASAGATPFGFEFTPNGSLIVSEAFGGAADASAVSSYRVSGGTADVVSASVATNQTAACWIVVTRDGKFTYTTNTGSSSVSGYAIAPDGSLTLLDADGRTGETGAGSRPIDAILDRQSNFLYVLSGGTNTVTAFAVGADGSLTNLGDVPVPAGSVGIVAR